MATDKMWERMKEQYIDEDTGEPVKEQGGCAVEFHMGTKQDDLLTDGGVLEKASPMVLVIRKMEQETLALLRSESPFTEEEPQPPKEKTPATERAYTDAHREWEERRKLHDDGLKEQATMLRQHHEHADLWQVKAAGRPIFRDVEMIRIFIPGDRDNVVDREVRKSDIQAYRTQYMRWKEGKTQASAGTPLAQWPKVTQAQVEELAYFNIRTVEALAQTSDVNLQNIGQYLALRQKARDWIATSRGTAPIEEARAEARRLAEENTEVKRQLAELSAAVAELRGQKPQHVQGQGQPKR